MTESASSATTTPTKRPSFWEDVIDIFFQPAGVFRRRENKSVWPPLLFVAISVAVIFFATSNVLEPIMDAEWARVTAKAVVKNPQAAEAMAKARGFSDTFTKYGIGVVMLVTM